MTYKHFFNKLLEYQWRGTRVHLTSRLQDSPYESDKGHISKVKGHFKVKPSPKDLPNLTLKYNTQDLKERSSVVK